MDEEIKTEETAQSAADAFNEAFLDATDTAPEGKTEEPAKEIVDDVKTTDDVPGDSGSDGDAAGDGDSGSDSGVAADTPVVEDEKPDEVQALRDQLAALQARLDTAPKVEKQPDPVVEEAPSKPIYSDDEEAAIKQYTDDWPEVVAGEALMRRKEYNEIVKYVFDEVAKRYEPLIEFYQNSSSRNQYSDIVSLVPDYDTVRDKTLDWIDTQPAFLKKAYTEVTETGTPEDIASLINIFKKETGYAGTTVPDTAKKTTSMPASSSKTPNPAKAEAAASLKIVKSGRSAISDSKPDQMDFEGSFEEAVKKRK